MPVRRGNSWSDMLSLSVNSTKVWVRAIRFIVLVVAIASAHGQNAATISGVVVDPSDAVIIDASVLLRSRTTHQERESKTDSTGSFKFAGVSYGAYDMEVRMPGFEEARIRVNASEPGSRDLRVVLPLAQLQADVTVNSETNRPNTEVEGNLDTISIDQKTLQSLPLLNGDVMSLAARLLGPRGAGAPVTVVVDGVEMPVTRLHLSQIRRLRINQNPYSAEYSGPGSSRIEITTAGGSGVATDFHGGVELSLRDALFDARNAFAETRPREQHRMLDAYLSGPLGDKKTSFNLNFWRDDSDLQSLVYALTPAGLVRDNVPNPQRNMQATFGLNRQVGRNNSMSFQYNYTTWTNRNDGVGGFVLPEAGANINSPSQDFTYNYTAVLSTNLINVFNVRGLRNTTTSRSLLEGVPQTVVLDAFTSGGSQADSLETRTTIAATDTVSWSHGIHSIRGGIMGPKLDRIGYDDRRNIDGTFYFSSLDDYRLGRPFSFLQQNGDGHLAFHGVSAAAFLQDNIQLRRNFSVGVGLRYEWQRYITDYNNLAPRVSFAYAPTSMKKTVFRGGAGLFYQPAPWGAIADTFRFNGSMLHQIVLPDPVYPNPFVIRGAGSVLPDSIVQLDPRLRIPYLLDYSFSVERQVGKGTLTATYNGQRAVKQFRSADLNAPLPPFYLARPEPGFGVVRDIESSGRAARESLRLGFRGDVTRYFSGTAYYVLSRSYSNTEGINYFPADQYSQAGEWARANNDQRHTFLLMGSLDSGKWIHFGLVSSLGSGLPYTLTTGQDNNQDSRAVDRPLGIARNSLVRPWSETLDLRWYREFFIMPSLKEKGPCATISVDAFNVLNRVNVATIVGARSSPFFGLPVASQPPRRLQFSLGFKF